MYCTSTNLFIDTATDGQTPCYLQLYPKLVWLVISSKTIKEQMFTNKSEPSKVQSTLQNSSWPCELQNIHLVLTNSAKSVR